jgi:hypothetical protein
LCGKLEQTNWGRLILQQIPAPAEIVNGDGESERQLSKSANSFLKNKSELENS